MIYAMVACLWILFSDQIIDMSFSDKASITRLQTVKGWFFVCASAVFIFFMISRATRLKNQTTAQILESEHSLQTLLDRIPFLIVALNNEGIPVFWNRECERVTGYNADEMKSLALSAALEAGHKVCPVCALFQDSELARRIFTPQENVEIKSIEAPLKRKDGTIATVSWYRMDGPAPMKQWHHWATGVDINSRIIFERDNLIAAKADSLSLMAGGMAHDLKNLFTAMEGGISLASDLILQVQKTITPPATPSGPDNGSTAERSKTLERLNESSDVLREALSACNKAKDMANSLQAFARSRTSMEITRISPVPFLSDCVNKHLSGSQNRVIWEIDSDISDISGNTEILSQIMGNLVINARQSMNDKGLLNIRLSKIIIDRSSILPVIPGSYLKIQIIDQGSGMEEILLNRIFDPYFTTKTAGTGLGLTISLAAARRHGGTITVRSKAGEGSTFTLYLPCGETEIQKAEILTVKDTSASYSAKSDSAKSDSTGSDPSASDHDNATKRSTSRILLVDDETHILKITPRLLNRLGLRCDVASNGDEALQLVKNSLMSDDKYSLLILDLTLPGEERGDAILSKLRKVDPHLRALVSSGYSDDEVIINFASFGFDGAVKKPYDLNSLKSAVRNVLDQDLSVPDADFPVASSESMKGLEE
jgi:PAS domain S-box-containing protein